MTIKPKTSEYKRITGLKCACSGCYGTAYSQFYICAIDGFVLLCKDHDTYINRAAVDLLTNFNLEETNKWIRKYTTLPGDSPQRRFVSPEKSTSEKSKEKGE